MGTSFVRFLAACYLCFNMDYNTVLLALASLPPSMPPRRMQSGNCPLQRVLSNGVSITSGTMGAHDTLFLQFEICPIEMRAGYLHSSGCALCPLGILRHPVYGMSLYCLASMRTLLLWWYCQTRYA